MLHHIVQLSKRIIKGTINRSRSLYKRITIGVFYMLNRKALKQKGISKSSYIIINEWDYRHLQMMRSAREKGFRVANKDNMLKYKNSDTLYILASGPSINDITDEQWAHIGSCDSFGFNWFLVHPFVPTFYHMEIVKNNFDLFKECYTAKDAEFKKIPMVINMSRVQDNQNAKTYEFIDNLFVSTPKAFSGAKKQNLEEILYHYYFHRDYSAENLIVHYRASLMLAITFGILMSYKKIVLAGVDMDSNDYFMFDESKYQDSVAIKVRDMKIRSVNKHLNDSKLKTVHRTVDPHVFNGLPLDQAIFLLDECVLRPKNIELYLLSKKSLLYPSLKVL